MQDFMTTSEAAEKWGITPRQILSSLLQKVLVSPMCLEILVNMVF